MYNSSNFKQTSKVLTFLLISIFCNFKIFAQTEIAKDTISYTKKLGSYTFYLKNDKAEFKDVKALIKSDPIAFEIYKKRRVYNAIGIPLSFVGGFLTGYSLGSIGYNNEVVLKNLVPGVVFLSTAFVLGAKSDKILFESVRVYNKNVLSGV